MSEEALEKYIIRVFNACCFWERSSDAVTPVKVAEVAWLNGNRGLESGVAEVKVDLPLLLPPNSCKSDYILFDQPGTERSMHHPCWQMCVPTVARA